MALTPWDVLGGGRFRTDAEEEKRRKNGEKGRTVMGPNWEHTEEEKTKCRALEKVAKEVGTEHLTSGELSIRTYHHDHDDSVLTIVHLLQLRWHMSCRRPLSSSQFSADAILSN